MRHPRRSSILPQLVQTVGSSSHYLSAPDLFGLWPVSWRLRIEGGGNPPSPDPFPHWGGGYHAGHRVKEERINVNILTSVSHACIYATTNYNI